MSVSLKTLNGSKEAVARRLREKRGGLGYLAAKDSELAGSVERQVHGKGTTKQNKKLQARQEAWRMLDKTKGSFTGPGKRYPEGYRMPGSNK